MVNISIIIPSYKRKDSLIRLIKNLAGQTKKDTEIIVVEQGENNGNVYRIIARELHMQFSYIFQKEISASKAKNRGARKACGKYLIFYDDDVLVGKNAVANIVRNFSDPSVGGVAGRVVDVGRVEEPGRRDVGRIYPLGIVTGGFSSRIRQNVDTVIGCNAAWRKNVFDEIGGFDERFTGNAMREESDLSLRVKAKGYHIVFDPTATVVHLREPHGGARKIDDRFYWYFHFFSNEAYFFLKHQSVGLFPIFLFTRISYILRCMFGFGREVSVRSIKTPFIGIVDGIDKYRKFIRS